MTQILPGTFEELGRVLQRRATGKTKGDMVFSDHDIAKRSIPFERRNAPRIDGFARFGNGFANQRPHSVSHRLELGVFLRNVGIDRCARFHLALHPQTSIKRPSGLTKISSHQFISPSRFAYFAARGKTFAIRFYIQHRCVVHSVEFADRNFKTLDKEEFANGDADAVGPVFRAPREDAHVRPIGASARMPRAFFHDSPPEFCSAEKSPRRARTDPVPEWIPDHTTADPALPWLRHHPKNRRQLL